MSKSSTVTVREAPVAQVASASVGGLTIHGETFVIETDQRVELVDLTNRIMDYARKFKIREGLISLWSMHTTCAVFINEFQTALLTDIKAFLEKMVARDEEWLHNNPDHSDCDRMNADAHLRALLLGQGPPEVAAQHVRIPAARVGIAWRPAEHFAQPPRHPLRMLGGHFGKDRRQDRRNAVFRQPDG